MPGQAFFHVGKLKKLLARNEAIEAADDRDWADCAALDCSPEFKRHQRYQSAKTRELLRMLDTLCKMRNAGFGMRNGKAPMAADDEGQMANDGCRMADDECQEAEGELEIEIEGGDCDEGPSSEPMKEACSGPVVGYDSNRVIDDSSNDKIGILSHEGAYAASQPRQGDDAGQCFPDHVTTPRKAPNKAIASKSVLLGEVDPALLAKIDAMADESDL